MTRTTLFSALAYTFFAFVIYTIYINYGSATGNFDFLLLVFAVVAVGYKLLDKYYLKTHLLYDDKKRPAWITYTADSWSVALLILVLRGIYFEATYVPTASLEPSVMIGDFVLVNKTAYAYRFPGATEPIGYKEGPKLGDIVVFNQYKSTESGQPERWVKRVIGTPGDIVEYDFENKTISINGLHMHQNKIDSFSKEGIPYSILEETLTNVGPLTDASYLVTHDTIRLPHKIQVRTDYSAMLTDQMKNIAGCKYSGYRMTCTVPADSYFMMGDNRDDSYDSRFWGFVNKKDIVGKAFLTVFNFKTYNRFLMTQ